MSTKSVSASVKILCSQTGNGMWNFEGVTKKIPCIYEDDTGIQKTDIWNFFTQVLSLPPKDTTYVL